MPQKKQVPASTAREGSQPSVLDSDHITAVIWTPDTEHHQVQSTADEVKNVLESGPQSVQEFLEKPHVWKLVGFEVAPALRIQTEGERGQGAFGSVYNVTPAETPPPPLPPLVVKFVRRSSADEPTYMARFAREVQNSLKFAEKKIGPKVASYGLVWVENEADVRLAIVMEALDCDLHDFVKARRGTVIEPEIVRFTAVRILRALKELAQQGICCTDLKPQNMVVNTEPRLGCTGKANKRANRTRPCKLVELKLIDFDFCAEDVSVANMLETWTMLEVSMVACLCVFLDSKYAYEKHPDSRFYSELLRKLQNRLRYRKEKDKTVLSQAWNYLTAADKNRLSVVYGYVRWNDAEAVQTELNDKHQVEFTIGSDPRKPNKFNRVDRATQKIVTEWRLAKLLELNTEGYVAYQRDKGKYTQMKEPRVRPPTGPPTGPRGHARTTRALR
jgi:serine/threonine protein kinase